MKIVIDIPEEDYLFVKRQVADGITNPLKIRIANGTPLPKGHGDLVDEKDLSLMTVHMIDGVFICDAPTIIEADKEGEQE